MKKKKDEINLPPFGKIQLENPRMSTIYDIVSTWTTDPSTAHVGRLSAAAIGVCAVNGLPKYDSDQARPIAYGGRVMDALLDKGVPPALIVEKGMEVLTKLAPMLIKEIDVKKK